MWCQRLYQLANVNAYGHLNASELQWRNDNILDTKLGKARLCGVCCDISRSHPPVRMTAFHCKYFLYYSYNKRQHSHNHVPMHRLAEAAKNIRYIGVKCQVVFRMDFNYCSSPHCYKKAFKDMRLLAQHNWNFNLGLWYQYVLICSKCWFLIWLFMLWCVTGSVRPVLAYVKAINPSPVMVMQISVVPVCYSLVYFLIANLINHCYLML